MRLCINRKRNIRTGPGIDNPLLNAYDKKRISFDEETFASVSSFTLFRIMDDKSEDHVMKRVEIKLRYQRS